METKYKIIWAKKDLKRLVKACKTTGYCCYDFETNAEPLYKGTFYPTILSISFQPGMGVSIPLNHFETKERCGDDYNWKKALLYLGHKLIENPDIIKVAQNAKFDNQIWERYHIYYRGTLIDTMIAKYILNENKPHGLKDLVRRYLPDFGDYEKQNKFDRIPWDKKPLEPLCKYGCTDTDMTLRLALFFEKKLIDLGMYHTFRNLFMTASRLLTSVEKEGLLVDATFNKHLVETYGPKIDQAIKNIMDIPKVSKFNKRLIQEKIDNYVASLESELSGLDYNDPKDARKIKLREEKISNIRAGVFTTKKELELTQPLNLNSNPQMRQLMYTHPKGLKFGIIKLSDSGEPSLDEETLVKLRLTIKDPESPKAIVLDNLLELRGLEKMYKTYILGWQEKLQSDSRLHGRINIIGTDSNRYSSSEPNIQQIPKTSVDPNIKKQLIAPPGKLYFVCDYSQAELRMMAHLSGDETYLEAFSRGDDPHLTIAAKKYGVPIEEASKAYNDENHPDHKLWKVRRKQAKQIAFGLIYGIGDALLAIKLSDPKAGLIVSKEEAHKQMEEFFEEHPKILKFKKKQEKFLRKHGYYRQLFGTKRRLPEIWEGTKEEQAYAVRLGMNFPCLLPSSQALSKTKGWVNYENLQIGDEILAFNPETGKSEWQPVLGVNVFDYKGDMIRLHSNNIDVLSTPDHRWYVGKPKKLDLTQLRVKTSKELFNTRRYWAIPIRAPHNNINKPRYDDNFIAFIGWYLTDGHLMKRLNIRITQSIKSNSSKVKIIDKIIKGLNVRYSTHLSHDGNTKVWTILDRDFVGQINKSFPGKCMNMNFISSLPQHQLEILLKNLRLGDGWSVFSSGKRDQAELVQALVVLCNNSSSMYELSHKGDRSYFKGGKPSAYGQEYIISKHTSYGIKFSHERNSVHTRNTRKEGNNFTKVKYKGKVWCPTVPSGAFFTRVVGEDKRYRTLITGNCQGAAANMTNFGAVLIYWAMRQGKLPMMKEACTVHDALYYYADPNNINLWTIHRMWDILRNPETKHYFGFQIDDVDMDMDFSIGRSMAEELPFIPGYDYRKMLHEDFNVNEYMELYHSSNCPHIKDYPRIFKKEIAKYEEDYRKGRY